MSSYQPVNNEVTRFVAGDGIAPPETIGGPRQLSKILTAMETGDTAEKQSAQQELGADFVSGSFDLEKINRNLRDFLSKA